MNKLHHIAAFAIGLACCAGSQMSLAQQTGGLGTGGLGTGGMNTGGMNTGGTGTSTGGGLGSGGRTFTNPGSNSNSSGQSGANQAGAGETGSGIGAVERRFGDVGEANANGTTAGSTGLGGMGGMGGAMGGFGGMGGMSGLGAFGTNPFGTGSGQATTKPTLRTRLRSGIEIPADSTRRLAPATVVGQVRTFSQPRFRQVGITAGPNGGTVLRGTVSSEADRRMAELLLRLEPGVREIDNQLTVSPQ